MSYHPSAIPPGRGTTGKSPLRLVGALLALAALLLGMCAMFFHAGIAGLIMPALICLFSLRVLFLWLGANKAGNAVPASHVPQPAATWAVNGMQPIANGSYAAAEPQQAGMHYPQYQQNSQQQYAQPQQSQQALAPPQYAPVAMTAAPMYVPQPSFTPASAYTQSGAPTIAEHYQPPLRPSQPYIPIAEDEMFALDQPGADECCFILPKEGEPLVECQDRYALNSMSRCYAVADGVAGSFVPGPWARTVAQGFVGRNGEFASKEDFQRWLKDCSNRWHIWMEERWVPTMNALRERNGDAAGDWSNDIRQGAQTTLIGCALYRSADINDVSTRVRICAIGDSEFLRFSPGTNGIWKLVETFPFSDPAEFNARPDTLISLPRADLLERTWQSRKTKLIHALPGDRLVLATDTLAKWLLGQVQQGNASRWMPLITCRDASEFEQRIRHEFYADHVDDDDVTMLIIPIP